MNDRMEYSFGLLAMIWLCAALGIFVEALYPMWKWKSTFSLSMYLGMGWCAVVCLPELKERIEPRCLQFLILGGVGYTAGECY
jgi:hemolysin III